MKESLPFLVDQKVEKRGVSSKGMTDKTIGKFYNHVVFVSPNMSEKLYFLLVSVKVMNRI